MTNEAKVISITFFSVLLLGGFFWWFFIAERPQESPDNEPDITVEQPPENDQGVVYTGEDGTVFIDNEKLKEYFDATLITFEPATNPQQDEQQYAQLFEDLREYVSFEVRYPKTVPEGYLLTAVEKTVVKPFANLPARLGYYASYELPETQKIITLGAQEQPASMDNREIYGTEVVIDSNTRGIFQKSAGDIPILTLFVYKITDQNKYVYHFSANANFVSEEELLDFAFRLESIEI
jgi:hypothetical protein